GVNGIAGTLYSVISAPGLDGPIVYNVGCAALILTFIAYLYFQSPIGPADRKSDRRRGYWIMLHLPLLISLVLLLVGEYRATIVQLSVLTRDTGVKKQFLLSVCTLT
ncbi:putative transmembrane protein, partial [Rhizoctonia solani 123E]